MSLKYGSSSSKYCYPDTYTLINKLDIHDDNLLKEAESLYTAQRLLELQAEVILGNFDLNHLLAIHYYIFQDLYDFAGKIREEDISKEYTFFAKFPYIVLNAEKLLKDLQKENYLKELNQEEFSNKAAYYMAELNVIHPFREGNGRTIREFIRCLALNSNFILNWNAIDKDDLLQASIKSVMDSSVLAKSIKKCIDS